MLGQYYGWDSHATNWNFPADFLFQKPLPLKRMSTAPSFQNAGPTHSSGDWGYPAVSRVRGVREDVMTKRWFSMMSCILMATISVVACGNGLPNRNSEVTPDVEATIVAAAEKAWATALPVTETSSEMVANPTVPTSTRGATDGSPISTRTRASENFGHFPNCAKLCDNDFWANATPDQVSAELRTADVTARTETTGETPLHVAASLVDDPTLLAILLDQGADPNASNAIGWTPLHWAANAVWSNDQVIALLIDRGADVNARDSDGLTPLHYAATNSHPSIVHLFIDRGADPSHADNIDIATPLHLAAAYTTEPKVIDALLKRGRILEARDYLGQTPLHHAAALNPNLDVIEHLLNLGRVPGGGVKESV